MGSYFPDNNLYISMYIIIYLIYGVDTWSMTSTSSRRIDALDQWCLRHILHIPYTAHVTNDEVRRRTCQPPATHLITTRRLHLFGHIARAGPSQDHSHALRAAISRLPVDQDEPGFERLSSTFSSIISESTPPGSVCRTVPTGANS